MKKYRIIENVGLYTIEVYEEVMRTSLFGLLFPRKKQEWVRSNIYGNGYLGYSIDLSCKSFSSLEEAKAMVELFKKGAIIHECND